MIEKSISIMVKDSKDAKIPIEILKINSGDLRGFSVSIFTSFDIECKVLISSNGDRLTERTILQDNLSVDGFSPASCRDDLSLLNLKIGALMDLWGLPSQLSPFAMGIKIELHPNSVHDVRWIISGQKFGD
jgi:hypothetical protein